MTEIEHNGTVAMSETQAGIDKLRNQVSELPTRNIDGIELVSRYAVLGLIDVTPYPRGGGTVDVSDIISALEETLGFAAISPAGKDNIEFCIEKLEKLHVSGFGADGEISRGSEEVLTARVRRLEAALSLARDNIDHWGRQAMDTREGEFANEDEDTLAENLDAIDSAISDFPLCDPSSSGPWDGKSVEALIEQYANGIYISRHSLPSLYVCREHLRAFLGAVTPLIPIKPLQWLRDDRGWWVSEAYRIYDATFGWEICVTSAGSMRYRIIAETASLSAAEKFVQAHYEADIRSRLSYDLVSDQTLWDPFTPAKLGEFTEWFNSPDRISTTGVTKS